MRILLTGSRDWSDYRIVKVVLLGVMHAYESPLEVAEGCADGLDSLAERFCEEFGVPCRHYPAQWRSHTDGSWCRARCETDPHTCWGAGARRNQLMLDDFRPRAVIGFKDALDLKSGSGGTEDMLSRAENADVPTFHVDHGPSLFKQGVLL